MTMNRFLPLLGTALLTMITIIAGNNALAPASVAAPPDASAAIDTNALANNIATRQPTIPSVRPDIYYNAILDRPLFAPTRMPQLPEPERAQAAPAQPLETIPATTNASPTGILLSGIIGAENSRSALLGLEGTNQNWVRIDDKIEGWTITAIGADWLELSLDHQTYRLELFE